MFHSDANLLLCIVLCAAPLLATGTPFWNSGKKDKSTSSDTSPSTSKRSNKLQTVLYDNNANVIDGQWYAPYMGYQYAPSNRSDDFMTRLANYAATPSSQQTLDPDSIMPNIITSSVFYKKVTVDVEMFELQYGVTKVPTSQVMTIDLSLHSDGQALRPIIGQQWTVGSVGVNVQQNANGWNVPAEMRTYFKGPNGYAIVSGKEWNK